MTILGRFELEFMELDHAMIVLEHSGRVLVVKRVFKDFLHFFHADKILSSHFQKKSKTVSRIPPILVCHRIPFSFMINSLMLVFFMKIIFCLFSRNQVLQD